MFGMKMTQRYPRALQTCASPIPVFPAVPSTTVPPGFKLSSLVTSTAPRQNTRMHTHRPRFSASRITPRAARSFTLPPGFCSSLLATISQPVSFESFSRRICARRR